MKLLRRSFFVFLFLCLAVTAVHAQITMTADNVTYDEYRGAEIGSGHVIITDPDFKITGFYVKHYPKLKRIIAEDEFTLEMDGYRIFGTKLDFYYDKKTGQASMVRINFGRTYLGGGLLRIEKDKFNIINGYFTGCNAPDSHYHVSSNELILYPKTGLIVAYWATFWVGAFPVLPVPTFVYSTPVPPSKFVKVEPKTEEEKRKEKELREKGVVKGAKTEAPVAKFGSNPVDGWFIKQPFNWYLAPRWYIKFMLMYVEKSQLGIGLRTNYSLFNDMNEGELRITESSGDGTYGGITHYFCFGPRLYSKEEEEELIYNKFKPGGNRWFELELLGSYRERINLDENIGPFSRVSFLPKATLRWNRRPVYMDELTFFAEASGAIVSEEATDGTGTEANRGEVKGDFTYKISLPYLGDFTAKIDGAYIDYKEIKNYISEEAYWAHSTQSLSLITNFGDVLQTELGHEHYVHLDGATPFEFEQYWYSPYDTFIGGAKLNLWYSSIHFKGTYDLPSEEIRRAYYQLVTGMHCYDLIFTYQLVRNEVGDFDEEFTFGFDLVPSRWIEK